MPKKQTVPLQRAKKDVAGGVVVKVDPAMKRLYAQLVAVISKTANEEMQDFDARWEAAAKIVEHRPPLYAVGNFKTANEFYVAVMKEEPRNAQRFLRVAKFASAKDEATYGVSKLDAALGFIEAKLGHPLAHPPLPVAFDKLRIPVAKKMKLLADASVAEIRAATSALTSSSRKTKSVAAESLEHALGKVTSLSGVTVREKDGIVAFTNVPLAAWNHFVRALTSAKLDP